MTEKFKRILLPTDGSNQATEAIRYVGTFFRPTQTEVVLFHVEPEIPEPFLDLGVDPASVAGNLPIEAWASRAKKNVREFMEGGRDILIHAGFPEERIVLKTQTREIGIARDIVEEAERGYDAVVVSRSGVSGLKGVVVGSVAHKVVSRIHSTPIAVVGENPEPQKVLICFDGSKGSMNGVDLVCSMMPSEDRIATLCLVVTALGSHSDPDVIFKTEHEKAWLKTIDSLIEASFSEAENRLINAGFHPGQVYIRVLENLASRAAGVIEAAEKGGFGTIVVGRRGLSDVEEFTMGRVTRKVLHMADKMAVWVA